MFLNNFFVQASIIIVVVFIFIISYAINRKVKPPKGYELPEKCHTCESHTCMIKLTEIEKYKKEIKEELEKCEKE